MSTCFRSSPRYLGLSLSVLSLLAAVPATAQGESKLEFPPFEEVAKDYERVISTADDARSLYTLYVNKKKQQLLAELPPNFEGQRIFIATSIAGGSRQTGYQWADLYCYWTRLDDQLVLMEPNLQRQASGGPQNAELQAAVKRTYSDRVVTSAKILTLGPNRGPVIDLDELLIKNSEVFVGMRGNDKLARLGNVKAFPQNVEIPVTIPMAGGQLTTLHYSISVIPKTNYKPLEADERIGYFLTVYKDFAKSGPGGDQFVRYVNRWNIQKRDPNLSMSPPTEPIVFYIEHTVPVRYRRYVREGILEWNKAFEKVGIIDAIEVRQQDAQSGAFMDIDPEDVRYNFFRWISSERAFAMGPSRVNPETGEILDADIIFDDSMLKLYATRYKDMIAAYGLDGVNPQALEFIQERPLWDPISRFEKPNPVSDAIANDPHLSEHEKADLLGEAPPPPSNRLLTRVVQQSHHCNYAYGKALRMQTASLAMRLLGQLEAEGASGDMIDGVPEEYLGSILKEIVMHEVGHTLGLRHNFKASAWLSLDEYVQRKGQANVGSVMDYNPAYISPDPEAPRGDWVTTTLGPYDYHAIEFGYTFDDKKRKELAALTAKPEFRYATDEDRSGPDPLVDTYDLSSDPLVWAKLRMNLITAMRAKLLDKAVEEGQSWHLLRRGYEQLLAEHLGALRTAGKFVGGVYVSRNRKGDPEATDPLVPVEAAKQREAMQFIIDNAFADSVFDLRPEVLTKLAADKNTHWGNFRGSDGTPEFSIHDRVMQIQSFALLYLMNPGTLGRVYDNELRTPADQDALTLPELMGAVVDNIYAELSTPLDGQTFTNRQPMISSLRRNLQSEMTARLIDVALNPSGMPRPIQALATHHLRAINAKLDAILAKANTGQVDDYTLAHLADLNDRVDKALNAVQIVATP